VFILFFIKAKNILQVSPSYLIGLSYAISMISGQRNRIARIYSQLFISNPWVWGGYHEIYMVQKLEKIWAILLK
jgi:hypothetical protein